MEITKEELEALKDIQSRSKGWPVGIWINRDIAISLVDKELARWAVPSYQLPDDLIKEKNISSVSITSWGKAQIIFS